MRRSVAIICGSLSASGGLMLGAIVGDFIGSIYEKTNYRPRRPTQVHIPNLITRENFFTDDTVLTIATADLLCNKKPGAETLREYTWNYPDAGYSEGHWLWTIDDNCPARKSEGNGAAMRISPYAYMHWHECGRSDEFYDGAITLANLTHNTPKAMVGAACLARCIFSARHTNIASVVRQEAYELEMLMIPPELVRDEAIPSNRVEDTLPYALLFALESEDFEDCMRRCLWFGVDADTICCMAGALAAELHGIPQYIKDHVLFMLDVKHPELFKVFQECSLPMGIKW